jgi:hypothetical protein
VLRYTYCAENAVWAFSLADIPADACHPEMLANPVFLI